MCKFVTNQGSCLYREMYMPKIVDRLYVESKVQLAIGFVVALGGIIAI
jgi:hypothetical protein